MMIASRPNQTRPALQLKRALTAVGGSLAWMAFASLHADAATIYDAVNDFSIAGSPNGVWRYGTLSSVTGGTLTLFNTPSSNVDFTGELAWTNGGSVPNNAAVVKNGSGSTQTYAGGVTQPINELRLDGANFIADVRFVSPALAVYSVTGLFQRIDPNGQPVTVSIIENGTTTLFSVNNFTTYNATQTFSFPALSLPVGTTLDFVESAPQYPDDSTGLAATILRAAPTRGPSLTRFRPVLLSQRQPTHPTTMFRPSIAFRLLISAFALTNAWSAHAATYDAVKDFSLSANPNGVWSYGTLSQVTSGAFSAFTVKDSGSVFTGSADWYNGQAIPNDAAVEANTSGQTQSIAVAGNGVILVPADQLRLDGENYIATVRWTAPANGTYNVSGFFQRNDNQDNSDQPVPVTVTVLENSATVLFQQTDFTAYTSRAAFNLSTLTLPAGTTLDFVESPTVYHNDSTGLAVTITNIPAFFAGQVSLSNGVYYLSFSNGNIFGYYGFLSDPNYLYHFDLGYEYVFDTGDGQGGVFLYDFKSGSFFYTSPTFGFPYLYDFSLNTVLYYFPTPTTRAATTRTACATSTTSPPVRSSPSSRRTNLAE